MQEQFGKSPKYIHETEALLMSPYFADEPRASALYDDFEALGYEELGARELVYMGALRILAQARADERNVASRGDTDNFSAKCFNESWRLEPKKILEISRSYREQIGRIARKLAILNNAESAINESLGAKGYEGLYDHQKAYLSDIVSMMQKGPAPIVAPEWYDDRERNLKVQGILLQAPTGLGKSSLMARTAVSMGAGRSPVEHDTTNPELAKPIRIALLAPSQALIAQLSGEADQSSLQRLAPGLKITSYYGGNKDLSGDLVVISNKLFVRDFDNGWIGDQYFDYVFIDEVHHLTEPKFSQALIERWDGPTIGFTARSAYSTEKDAANILRYGVDHGDMQTFMEQGKLNKLELYTARFLPEDMGFEPSKANTKEQRPLRHGALTELLCEFVQPLLAEGRQGIIFCEPGGKSTHAQQLCRALNSLDLPIGRVVRAEAIGVFNGLSNSPKNRAAIKRFNTGETDILTTTLMGQEGLDFRHVDFIGLAPRLTSSLQFQQMIGRGTRLSDRFPTTIVGHFIPIGFGRQNSNICTFQSLFGIDRVQQGYVVGTTEQDSHKTGVDRFPAKLRAILEKTDGLKANLVRASGRAFKEGVRTIPDGYLSLDDIISEKAIGHQAARIQLIKSGYHGIQKNISGSAQEHRDVFFEPAAATFFSDAPEPPRIGSSDKEIKAWADINKQVTMTQLAEYFSTSVDALTYHLSASEREQGRQHRVASHARLNWSQEAGALIRKRLEKKLFFPAHVLTFKGVADILGVPPSSVRKHISRRWEDIGVEDIEPRGKTTQAIPWSGVQKIQAHYGLRGDIKDIDYSKLPMDSNDTDPEKIRYARSLQLKVLPANWLPREITY